MPAALPPHVRLLPLGHVGIGECALARRPMLLTTVLGSCVCATFHHPQSGAGGMFHAMLPDSGAGRRGSRPCTYADAAVEAMLARLAELGAKAAELEVKLFGGANTMQDTHPEALREMLDVGRKNAESALCALASRGLKPLRQDILGALGRKLYFATATGEIWLSYLDPAETRRARAAEAEAAQGGA